jgi:hypothetical protein
VSVVCCQVEVSATGWSLVQRSPTECDVSKKCVIVKPRKMRRPRPPRGLSSHRKKNANGVDSTRGETEYKKLIKCLIGELYLEDSTEICS